MPGLSNPEVIDLVSVTPDGATCCLHIVGTERWRDRPDTERLNEKLLNYVGFALDGQLVQTYPEVAGLPVRIVIDAYFGLTLAAVDDLDVLRRSLSRYGIELTWNDGLSINPSV